MDGGLGGSEDRVRGPLDLGQESDWMKGDSSLCDSKLMYRLQELGLPLWLSL